MNSPFRQPTESEEDFNYMISVDQIQWERDQDLLRLASHVDPLPSAVDRVLCECVCEQPQGIRPGPNARVRLEADARCGQCGGTGEIDAVDGVDRYAEKTLRVIWSQGTCWSIVRRDFQGLRVLHRHCGVDYVEWPVLRPGYRFYGVAYNLIPWTDRFGKRRSIGYIDPKVVFAPYVFNGERSVRIDDPSYYFPIDVVDAVGYLLGLPPSEAKV